MNKVGLIIKREYLTRVKKRSFIVMTFLGPVLFALFYSGAIFVGMSDSTDHNVLVADYSGIVSVQDSTTGKLYSRFPRRFESTPELTYNFVKTAEIKQQFKESPYTLLIELDDVALHDGKVKLYYKKVPSQLVLGRIEGEVENALEELRVVDSLNVSYADYKRMKVELSWYQVDISASTDEETHKSEQAMVGLGIALMIYVFIFLYGVQVMRGVIEEKTNRIVEVIVSSVKPFQLMMGKVIGIGMVGLTQFLLWVILCSIVSGLGSIFLAGSGEMTMAIVDGAAQVPESNQAMLQATEAFGFLMQIPWTTVILSFIFYFIGGYLLYGALFAAIGAAVDSETDTQQFMLPVAMPLVFGMIISSFLIMNPDGAMADTFAVVPFTSPIVMMVKVAMGETGWLLVISMIVLILSFLGTIWVAGRIYKTGILMYGKKTTYREIWKWITYKS